MPISQIEQVAVGKLRPHPTNVHIHSKKQIAQIANSIGQFGFIDPIICNESGNRVARRRSMSALGVKSRHVQRKRSCPLYPRKRTFAVQLGNVRFTPESLVAKLRWDTTLSPRSAICAF